MEHILEDTHVLASICLGRGQCERPPSIQARDNVKTFGKMHLFLLALVIIENILVLIVFLVVSLVLDLIVDIVNFVVDIDDDIVHVGNGVVHVVSVPLDFLNAVDNTTKATDEQSNQETYPQIQISKLIANLQLSTTLVLLIRVLLLVVVA
jgi:hypothetical protein